MFHTFSLIGFSSICYGLSINHMVSSFHRMMMKNEDVCYSSDALLFVINSMNALITGSILTYHVNKLM